MITDHPLFNNEEFYELWVRSLKKYSNTITPTTLIDAASEIRLLESIGMSSQEFYDFIDDFFRYGEPDFAYMALIQDVRKNYFLDVQKRKISTHVISMEKLPSKEDKVKGIPWLPRIIQKAYAKLKGEMPNELMYGCAGDRRFFRENNIHPAEFLLQAWKHENNPLDLINWVITRRRLYLEHKSMF